MTAYELRDLADDEIAALCNSGEPEAGKAAITEMTRRDQRARQSAADKAWWLRVSAEWHDFAYAQYLAADSECRGELLSKAGEKAGIIPWPALWHGPMTQARKYASDELLEFWDDHPRMTVSQYAWHAARPRRGTSPPAPAPEPEPEPGTGFTWSCACGAGGTDRDGYAAHHKEHGRRPPATAWQPWQPWKAPRPGKPREPRPADPGQRITWVRETPGRWEGRTYSDSWEVTEPGTWIPPVSETRQGTVWSVATTATEWWVLPDDDPQRPVLVRRSGKRSGFTRREGDLYEVAGYADRARANVLRAEEIRRRGIYPVLDYVSEGYWNHRDRRREDGRAYVKWHSDPDCPLAEGKERYDRQRHGYAAGYYCGEWPGRCGWTPIDVAISLTRGKDDGSLCTACITGLPV